MTIQEAIKIGKPVRRKSQLFGRSFGQVLQLGDKVVFLYGDPANPTSMPLSMSDIIADDWEVERAPRTYYLGMIKFQLPTMERLMLQAVETENGAEPTYHTADGKPWIKVVEVIE